MSLMYNFGASPDLHNLKFAPNQLAMGQMCPYFNKYGEKIST